MLDGHAASLMRYRLGTSDGRDPLRAWSGLMRAAAAWRMGDRESARRELRAVRDHHIYSGVTVRRVRTEAEKRALVSLREAAAAGLGALLTTATPGLPGPTLASLHDELARFAAPVRGLSRR
jgi:hypothetical protein